MKQKGFGKTVVCWMIILSLGLALTGCGACRPDVQPVDTTATMDQDRMQRMEDAQTATAEDAQRAQNAATRAENAAARAEAAAAQAEQAAAQAEAIFMQRMQK
jgi:uncharacterized protein HemX